MTSATHHLLPPPSPHHSNLRLETGYIAEIAVEAGMLAGHNVWIDGSLRDTEWHSRWFAKIRKAFPNYRIAIVYVSVTSIDIPIARYESQWRLNAFILQCLFALSLRECIVMHCMTFESRAAKRAIETGRAVPVEDIKDRCDV